MAVVSEQDALTLWESSAGLTPLGRTRLLMRLLHPRDDADALMAMSVGARNARVLEAFAATFGDSLPCEAACPRCGARLEFALGIGELLASHREAPAQLTVQHDGAEYRARVPTDADLWHALADGSGPDGVMARCALAPAIDAWPAAAVTAVEDGMARSDPLSVIAVSLACPECEHAWRAALDVVDMLCTRLTERATGLLSEVHRLAQAYGWSESHILAMSRTRRRHYLALLAN